MQRRSVLGGAASLLALCGCLDVRSIEGQGGASGNNGGRSGDGGSGGGAAPGAGGEGAYESGTMSVTVDGTPVDLTADRFQSEYAEESIRFHFHDGDEYWYMEGERVTFATAIDLLPRFAYDRAEGAPVVTVDGTTYDARDPAVEMAVRANGEPVDPRTYEVRDGDHLVIEVTTGG